MQPGVQLEPTALPGVEEGLQVCECHLVYGELEGLHEPAEIQ